MVLSLWAVEIDNWQELIPMERKYLFRSYKLQREIEKLGIVAFGPPEESSSFRESDYLEMQREGIIRARVLLDCAIIEEITAIIIMDHILDDCSKWNQTNYFGRIKKYRVLYDDVLGRLPARHKLAVVKKFIRIPKAIYKTIERMLALRDLFAHVATLDYTKRKALKYRGNNILSEAGFRSYIQDSREAIAFLIKKSSVLKIPKR